MSSRQTIAYAIANDAWAQELGPKYVTQQTTMADAAKDYTYTTADALRYAVGEFSFAVKTYQQSANADAAAAAVANADSLKTAIKANAAARTIYNRVATDSNKDYSLQAAQLTRDAKVEEI